MRILYIMNVEWNWIKQRPHFIAEKLSASHKMIVFYPYSYHRKGLGFVNNRVDGLHPHRYFNIPLRGRFPFVSTLNYYYLKLFFRLIIRINKPDAIWIGRPETIDILPKTKLPIIYDCMDDYYSMHNDSSLLQQESKVLKSAKCIFASSNSLIRKLKERYDTSLDVKLVRNGYDGKVIPLDENSIKKNGFTLCYVGTVSIWFDFALIDRIVEEIPDIKIIVIGPVEVSVRDKVDTYSNSSNVCFVGSVEHSKLYETVKEFNCLIMPFVLNEIIESVDPVKLYEYINYGKNIVSIRYDEILRFQDFVNFYSTHEEAIRIIRSLIEDNSLRYTDQERREFLVENTWDNRVSTINDTLKKHIDA